MVADTAILRAIAKRIFRHGVIMGAVASQFAFERGEAVDLERVGGEGAVAGDERLADHISG
jgi:hypothetical protein